MDKKVSTTKKVDIILRTVIALGEQMQELKTSVENKIESSKEDMLKEIRPISRAVDKDAVMIVGHEKRITRVERHLAIR